MRLDVMGLNNVLTNDVSALDASKLPEALQDYLQLKGVGKPKTFHQSSSAIRRPPPAPCTLQPDEKFQRITNA